MFTPFKADSRNPKSDSELLAMTEFLGKMDAVGFVNDLGPETDPGRK